MEVNSVSNSGSQVFSKASEEASKEILKAGQALKQAEVADKLRVNENATGENGGIGALATEENAVNLVNEEGKGNAIDLLG